MSAFDQILQVVTNACKYTAPQQDAASSPQAIKIVKEDLTAVARQLLENPVLYFDTLSCVTGIDNGPAAATMEVVYNLYSIPFHHHLMLKVVLPREKPEIETVTHLWKTANWHEREIFDMYGILFLNHPDMRRILMPADWEGHPLRKDYIQQEYYRNIKVKF